MEPGVFFDILEDGSFYIGISLASIVADTGRNERARARRRTVVARTTQRQRQQQPPQQEQQQRRRPRSTAARRAPVPFEQNVAAGGPGPAAFNPDAPACCIGVSCKEPRPDYTWLPCCNNTSVCIDCIVEHVRHNGSTCPLCRGDMNA